MNIKWSSILIKEASKNAHELEVKDEPGIPHFIRMIGEFRTRTLDEFRFWFERCVEDNNEIKAEDSTDWQACEIPICQKVLAGKIPLREGVESTDCLYKRGRMV